MATSKNTVSVVIEMHVRRKGGVWTKKDAFRLPNVKYFEELIEEAKQNGYTRRKLTSARFEAILDLLASRLKKARGEDAQYGAAKRSNCFKGMVSHKQQFPGSTALKIVAKTVKA